MNGSTPTTGTEGEVNPALDMASEMGIAEPETLQTRL